jgi:hypothetical protein
MVATSWLVALLGLPLWVGPPIGLLSVGSRTRAVRIAFGAVLAVALAFLYAVFCQMLQGPRLPLSDEGLALWGPTTLLVCGAAFVFERLILRRPTTSDGTEAGVAGSKSDGRLVVTKMLVAVLLAWSTCCVGCLLSPAAEMFDLRLDSPSPGLVLPMPDDLSLVSADRECGSELCAEIYRIGSPDEASLPEFKARLWAHLVGDKGWVRRRDDAACQRPGWFIRMNSAFSSTLSRQDRLPLSRSRLRGLSRLRRRSGSDRRITGAWHGSWGSPNRHAWNDGSPQFI